MAKDVAKKGINFFFGERKKIKKGRSTTQIEKICSLVSNPLFIFHFLCLSSREKLNRKQNTISSKNKLPFGEKAIQLSEEGIHLEKCATFRLPERLLMQ